MKHTLYILLLFSLSLNAQIKTGGSERIKVKMPGTIDINPEWKAIEFQSVQPATLNQVSIILQTLNATDGVYLDWGDGSLPVYVVGTADQTKTSNYVTNNKTYNVRIFGDLSRLNKFSINTEATVSNFNINQLDYCDNLTYLYLNNLGTNLTGSIDNLSSKLTTFTLSNLGTNLTGSIDNLSSKLTSLTLYNLGTNFTGSIDNLSSKLTSLTLRNLGTNLTGSIDNLSSDLTSLTLYNLGTNFTGSIDNLSSDLTTLYLYNLGTNFTGSIDNLSSDLTSLTLNTLGTNINITDGPMPAWASNAITITSGYNTASVDGFLNTWAATAGAGAMTIDLSGIGAGVANGARSSASNAAVTTLIGLSKTIKTQGLTEP
jgi:hypothetical protein